MKGPSTEPVTTGNYWLARSRERRIGDSAQIAGGHSLNGETAMSWRQKFLETVKATRSQTNWLEQTQRTLDEHIGRFFRDLCAVLEFEAKDVSYIDLDSNSGRLLPQRIDQGTPPLTTVAESGTGHTVFYAAVEARLADETTGAIPIWIRVAFRYPPHGLTATFGDLTVRLPDESNSMFEDIAEAINKKLAEQAIPPIKLGF